MNPNKEYHDLNPDHSRAAWNSILELWFYGFQYCNRVNQAQLKQPWSFTVYPTPWDKMRERSDSPFVHYCNELLSLGYLQIWDVSLQLQLSWFSLPTVYYTLISTSLTYRAQKQLSPTRKSLPDRSQLGKLSEVGIGLGGLCRHK